MGKHITILIAAISFLGACHFFGKDDASQELETPIQTVQSAAIGETCGGIAAITCAGENTFCQLDDRVCQQPDATGVCAEIQPFCTREYRPVCGCDGKTYGNRCTAQAAGVSVASTGECTI